MSSGRACYLCNGRYGSAYTAGVASAPIGEGDRAAELALTIEIVANQESRAPEKQQRAGCRPRSAIRLAHLRGEAAVPPGAARLLSAWQRDSEPTCDGRHRVVKSDVVV
jgi:hypothetical protein